MADNSKRSFQRKIKSKIISISGTKPSIHNSQLLISTGIPSLDFILGGGVPLGTLVLIEEDTFNEYSKYIAKLFLAEGLKNENFIYVSSFNDEPENIIHNLPGLRTASSIPINHSMNKNVDELEIAWRYKEQRPKTIEMNSCISNYDLRKIMDIERLSHLIYTYGLNTINFESDLKKIFSALLTSIQNKIKEHELRPHPLKEKSNALRIAFTSLLSPLWSSKKLSKDDSEWKEVLRFFSILKAVVRSSFTVALITIPSKFINPELKLSLHGIVDFVLNLESFQGSETEVNPLYKEYNGILYIKKLPVLNTMVPHIIDYKDWAFHINKGTLTFTRLHLPPEDSDTTSRAQENGIISCSSSKYSILDF